MFWFWFFVGPAIVLALLSLRGERKRAAYVAARLTPSGSYLPVVSLIVPVKGMDEGLRENLASLATQNYPDYELIVAAQAAADIPPGVLPDRVKVVVSCERDEKNSEKIQNLIGGVLGARRSTEVLAFADSDGRVSATWLRALVAPLAGEGVGASSGYRWYAPVPPTFWSLMRSVWNAAIASTFGPGPLRFAWGGAMAIRKNVFFDARVAEFWKNALSDDYALSSAVSRAGLKIVFAPGAMVASTDHISARDFFGWAKRQMAITRVYHRRAWWRALLAHFFYCGGMAAALIASATGHRGAEWALIAQLSPGMLKGANRATLAKAELPAHASWFERHQWVHTWWVPLATWIWMITLLSSAFTREIEWRGRRYVLRRPKSGYNDRE